MRSMKYQKAIFLGGHDDPELNETRCKPDNGAIREAVDTVARERGFDGYQVLSDGKVFLQSIYDSGTDRVYVYPVAAGVHLDYDYINDRDLFAPEAFLIFKTDTRIDPTEATPDDIVCFPVENTQLGKWLWSYWSIEEDLNLVILDPGHPGAD